MKVLGVVTTRNDRVEESFRAHGSDKGLRAKRRVYGFQKCLVVIACNSREEHASVESGKMGEKDSTTAGENGGLAMTVGGHSEQEKEGDQEYVQMGVVKSEE